MTARPIGDTSTRPLSPLRLNSFQADITASRFQSLNFVTIHSVFTLHRLHFSYYKQNSISLLHWVVPSRVYSRRFTVFENLGSNLKPPSRNIPACVSYIDAMLL